MEVVWLRRDLRLEDNTALNAALKSGNPVLLLFIFDPNILQQLPRNDARVSFIWERLKSINKQLNAKGSSLLCLHGDPLDCWKKVLLDFSVETVYCNKDYEPYALKRDLKICNFLGAQQIEFLCFKDQVIFEENEIIKDDGKPYTVFTPYKNKWLARFDKAKNAVSLKIELNNLHPFSTNFPDLGFLGFKPSSIKINEFNPAVIQNYADTRDFPSESTSHLGPHLRFGTVSIRQIISNLKETDSVFQSELIWREFFMQILFHFPDSVEHNFKKQYNGINWRNNEQEFERWCKGNTGYPLVDAGMRQLNATGFMHNRLRMITAGFLCKHLLIDWKWGETYFAEKLLDYELASNVGNWQWAAGTGCDAAPYFRIFNPLTQALKFDKNLSFIKKWVPEFESLEYPVPMVEHTFARERALKAYKAGILY
jgi:deoxyribodipyrimidine photo-lyase